MYSCFILLSTLLAVLIISSDGFNELHSNTTVESCPSSLSRKRRYLHFPEDSHFVITVSLLKSTPFEATVNTMHEIDVALPLPKSLYPPQLFHSRQEKMNVFNHVEAIIDLLGYNGKFCLQRLVCEVMFLNEAYVKASLVLNILRIIFRYGLPPEDETKRDIKFKRKIQKLKDNHCINKCSFSIFQPFLLKFN